MSLVKQLFSFVTLLSHKEKHPALWDKFKLKKDYPFIKQSSKKAKSYRKNKLLGSSGITFFILNFVSLYTFASDKIWLFSYQDIINASWSIWKQIGNCFSMRMCITWDICGRRLISLRLTACGSRLLSNWQSSTPSLRAWARSQTWHHHTHKVRRGSPERKAVCPQVCVSPVHFPMLPGGYQEGLDTRSTMPHTAATTPSLFSKQYTEMDAHWVYADLNKK